MAPLRDRMKNKGDSPVAEKKPLKASSCNGWQLEIWVAGQGLLKAPSGQIMEMNLDPKAGVAKIVVDSTVPFPHEACEKLYDMLKELKT